ncbi:MAG: M23 family metallopeptidase [Spirochaetaceae bacterium]|nr:M23 family metallopeptidase [Spirochaetaceae bacterium]
MPKTRRYKKFEKNVVQSIVLFFKRVFCAIGRAVSVFFHVGQRKLTIMVVPHSQKKVLNFQTNIFALSLGFLIVGGIVASFFWFNKNSIDLSTEITNLEARNNMARMDLDLLRDEVSNVLYEGKKFQKTLTETLSLLGIEDTTASTDTALQNGDLSSLFNVRETSRGNIREITDLRQLASYLENASRPIEEIGKMLDSQSALFGDIPSVWPLKGGIGHISMLFGQNIHPLTGQWYIHKGLDISTWRSGDPIISTATGQIMTVAFDAGLGHYVIIKHKHGFYTRYAHMSAIWVQRGQYVTQGQVIGTVGNSGVSTGPHLHYEVHIGADVVDPAKYVNMTVAKR